jgi:hypothetical protein
MIYSLVFVASQIQKIYYPHVISKKNNYSEEVTSILHFDFYKLALILKFNFFPFL